jgi:hypothetical protein
LPGFSEFSQPAPSTSKLPTSDASKDAPTDAEAAFMAELTKNMSQMFDTGGTSAPDAKAEDIAPMSSQEEADFRSFFEQMMRSSAQGSDVSEEELQETLKEMETRLKAVNTTAAATASSSAGASAAAAPTSFQDSVKQTYDKLKASDASARVSLPKLGRTTCERACRPKWTLRRTWPKIRWPPCLRSWNPAWASTIPPSKTRSKP